MKVKTDIFYLLENCEKSINLISDFLKNHFICKDCGEKMVPGKNGKLYCVACYKKWAAINKPR